MYIWELELGRCFEEKLMGGSFSFLVLHGFCVYILFSFFCSVVLSVFMEAPCGGITCLWSMGYLGIYHVPNSSWGIGPSSRKAIESIQIFLHTLSSTGNPTIGDPSAPP